MDKRTFDSTRRKIIKKQNDIVNYLQRRVDYLKREIEDINFTELQIKKIIHIFEENFCNINNVFKNNKDPIMNFIVYIPEDNYYLTYYLDIIDDDSKEFGINFEIYAPKYKIDDFDDYLFKKGIIYSNYDFIKESLGSIFDNYILNIFRYSLILRSIRNFHNQLMKYREEEIFSMNVNEIEEKILSECNIKIEY